MPEAVINYVALLGWAPTTVEDLELREFKDEIFNLHELTKMVLMNLLCK